MVVYEPNYLRATSKGYIFEHIAAAERSLGRMLDRKHSVHHVDGNGRNNSPDTGDLREPQISPPLLHIRMRVLAARCAPKRRRFQ